MGNDEWDGVSWREAELAAEKMVLRPYLALTTLGRAVPAGLRAILSKDKLRPHTISVSDEIVIAAPPEAVYARISDVKKMGSVSPENTGATLRLGDDRPYVGMEFDGHNKRGRLTWTTRCKVISAEPGVSFAFKVRAIGPPGKPILRFPIATWAYRLAPTADGATLVTETWSIGPWPNSVIPALDRFAANGLNGREIQRRNLRITLQNLKRVLEADTVC